MYILPTLNFYPEDGGDTFLQNFGNHLQDYTASKLRTSESRHYSVFYIFLENWKFALRDVEKLM
jgi:hypothetical protein